MRSNKGSWLYFGFVILFLIWLLTGCVNRFEFTRDGVGYIDCGDKNLSPEDRKTCENLKYFQEIQKRGK